MDSGGDLFYRVQGLGFRATGFRVTGFRDNGFRAWGAGFGLWDLGSTFSRDTFLEVFKATLFAQRRILGFGSFGGGRS